MDDRQAESLSLDAAPDAPHRPSERVAELALLLATVFWGCGFTWAKSAGEAVQRQANLPPGAALGPVFILAGRFLLGGLLLFLLIPATRRGWTLRGAVRTLGVGLLLAVGLIVQHLGLDRTSEAVSAFLTSLSVLFVPLILTVALRRPPASSSSPASPAASPASP